MELIGLELADLGLVLSWDLPELRELAFSLHPENSLDLLESDTLPVGGHGCNALESVRFICNDWPDDPDAQPDEMVLWLCKTLPPQTELTVRVTRNSDSQDDWTREVEAKYREQRQRDNHDGPPLGEEPAADSVPAIADTSPFGPTSTSTSTGATERLLQQILESNLRQEGLLRQLLDRS